MVTNAHSQFVNAYIHYYTHVRHASGISSNKEQWSRIPFKRLLYEYHLQWSEQMLSLSLTGYCQLDFEPTAGCAYILFYKRLLNCAKYCILRWFNKHTKLYGSYSSEYEIFAFALIPRHMRRGKGDYRRNRGLKASIECADFVWCTHVMTLFIFPFHNSLL